MKCPYCAEELKDDAVVCRFCQRDLMFFRPLHERLASVEERVSELSSRISRLSDIIASNRSGVSQGGQREHGESDSFQALRHSFPAVFAATTSILLFWLYFDYYNQDSPTVLWLSILAPLPFGLWCAVTWLNSHWKQYVAMGGIIGIASVIGTALIFGGVAADAISITAKYVSASTLLFTAGGLIGDWLEGLTRGKRPSPAIRSVARNLIGERADGDLYNQKLKFAERAISATTPVLTFIASIVSAYLTYAATSDKL